MNTGTIGVSTNSDIELSPTDFASISALALREFGLSLPKSKRQLVQSRLARRIRNLGLPDFNSYRTLLEGPDGKTEQTSLLSALTTNVTKFFREIHHFDDLIDVELPKLIENGRRGQRIRVWSAGCSSGQEAFSIALAAMKYDRNIVNYDFKILATDIDPEVLSNARSGIYKQEELDTISEKYYARSHISSNSDSEPSTFSVVDEVRNLIQFRELNLISKLPFRGKFDAIFCRNVAIYFDPQTQNSVWEKLAERLVKSGKLYIGHSERIRDTNKFGLTPTGITTYVKATSI